MRESVGFLVGHTVVLGLPDVGGQRGDRKGDALHADDGDHADDPHGADQITVFGAEEENRKHDPGTNEKPDRRVEKDLGSGKAVGAHAVSREGGNAEIQVIPLDHQHQRDPEENRVDDVKRRSSQWQKNGGYHNDKPQGIQ